MKCDICNGLGILPGLTKNTKCSYCDWGDVPDGEVGELKIKADLYDKFYREATQDGYSGLGDIIDSAKEWKKIAESQAQNTLDLQDKLDKISKIISGESVPFS